MSVPELRLLHDGNSTIGGLKEVLSGIAPVRLVNVRDGTRAADGPSSGAVICLNHSTIKSFDLLARTFDVVLDESVVVLPSVSGDYIATLKKFGIKEHLAAPVPPDVLIKAVSAVRNQALENSWSGFAVPAREALVASRASFAKVFDDIRTDGHVDIPNVEEACALIADFAKTNTLSDWLAAIKDHHDYTYRHCMSVCGMIVHFGHNLGIGSDDLNLLSVGGMLHDIGKARIPLAILDKPGKLDAAEQTKMREHPAQSRLIMDSMEGLDPRIVRMAVHHHEKLDGSGYPDGLSADQIDDLVRLTAIADVFSALIDERAYKAAMSFDEAFARMETMKGHLDLDMLVRFKEFAMDYRAKAA